MFNNSELILPSVSGKHNMGIYDFAETVVDCSSK
jgi:hypothetical protein